MSDKKLVRSARESFRRAGFTFTRAGIVVDFSRLTPAQREALERESNVSIASVPKDRESEPAVNAPADAEADGKGKGGAKK